MPETVSKPVKIFALSKEINVGPNTILDFLKDEGYNVKTIMSPLDEEMLNAVMGHFKKDRDSKEKRDKKTHEIEEHKKETLKKIEDKKISLSRPTSSSTELATPLLRKRPKKEPPLVIPPVEEPIPSATVYDSSEKLTPETIEQIEDTITLQIPETEEITEDKIPLDETDIKEPEDKRKKKEVVSGLERVREQKRGITVVGKIELEKKKLSGTKK